MTDELDKFKLWVVEILFTEEDLQEFESRGIDPIYEDSQVFVVGTVEFEASESRKDMACRRRWKSESPILSFVVAFVLFLGRCFSLLSS